MKVLGIDPGSKKSGWVILENQEFQGFIPTSWGWDENDKVQSSLSAMPPDIQIAVEYMHPRGQLMSKDALEMMFELGRMTSAYTRNEIIRVDRKDVKMYLLNRATGTDAMIRRAIIDLYGGDEVAIGGKRCRTCHGVGLRGRGSKRGNCSDCDGSGYETKPGVLHGISKPHVWDAFGVALTAIQFQFQTLSQRKDAKL